MTLTERLVGPVFEATRIVADGELLTERDRVTETVALGLRLDRGDELNDNAEKNEITPLIDACVETEVEIVAIVDLDNKAERDSVLLLEDDTEINALRVPVIISESDIKGVAVIEGEDKPDVETVFDASGD